jgi:hypothetical protein
MCVLLSVLLFNKSILYLLARTGSFHESVQVKANSHVQDCAPALPRPCLVVYHSNYKVRPRLIHTHSAVLLSCSDRVAMDHTELFLKAKAQYRWGRVLHL